MVRNKCYKFFSLQNAAGVSQGKKIAVMYQNIVAVNSEAKNMTSVMFFKSTRQVKASGHLDYFRRAVWRHFIVFVVVVVVVRIHYIVTIHYICL